MTSWLPAVRLGFVGAAALTLAGPALAGGSENDALAHIQELKQELREFKAQDGNAWLTEQRAAEVRGVVQDVLADADTRVSLQDSGATAGWNSGFFLKSSDGAFSLKIGGQVQVRWTLNNAKDQPATWGFSNRRTKLGFSGTVVDPSWSYKIKGAFGSGGTFALEDAYVAKKLDNGMSVKVGAFKAPWLREALVSSSVQLAADRSLVNAYFAQGYSKGMQLSYASDSWRTSLWYGNGVNSVALGYGDGDESDWNNNATRWSVAGRLEYLVSGHWKQFKSFSSPPGEACGVMLGFGHMAQKFKPASGETYGAGSGARQLGVTVDVTAAFGGASLFGAVVWNANDVDGTTTNPWGAVLQGGTFVSEDVELFGRFEYTNFDAAGPMANGQIYKGLTVGMNYFLSGTKVKLTVDWSMNLDSFGSFTKSSLGWRADTAGESDQWALRAQLQLLF